MASKSSFLPRLRLGRPDQETLPLYNSTRLPDRRDSDEYNLSELSPRPEDAFLPPANMASARDQKGLLSPRSPSPHHLRRDISRDSKASSIGSDSKLKPRALFAGPPPPIAASMLMSRDEEDGAASRNRPGSSGGRSLARSALSGMGSVFFDRRAPSRDRDAQHAYEPDTVWRSMQRRERALQKDLQHLLDVQSAGLAAHLDPDAAPSPAPTPSNRSERSGSNTPYYYDDTSDAAPSRTHSRPPRHVSFDTGSPSSSPAGGGVVVPVRQPRRKRMGLGAARAALGRRMAQLAALKAEEDERLDEALEARRRALAQLEQLVGRREGIVGELRQLEGDEEEPLARTLRELGDERAAVANEMRELEQRLAALRSRKRRLDGQIDEARNTREAGLSGYRGALREVDGKVTSLLRKPPVRPLDAEAVGGGTESPGGVEFVRMLPERRTADMARDWWQGEAGILELRKHEVARERAALEQGAEVWRGAVQLVTGFESDLRREMMGEEADTTSKGKQKAPTPEEAMRAQLAKMADVVAGLGELLRVAEAEGWNLLTCAIGAELEAFREARAMLREALRASGFGSDEDDGSPTPRLGRSASGMTPVTARRFYEPGQPAARADKDSTSESDNEVPPDLLVSHEEVGEHEEASEAAHDRIDDHEDSENEVPPEFLAQHQDD